MSDLPSDLTAESARGALERFIAWRNGKVLGDLQWSISESNAASKVDALKQQLDAKLLRRNQVLFCLGQIARDEFKYSDIEALVRERFPISNQGTTLNVTNALSELGDQELGILMRNPTGDAYMLKHPLFRAAIRQQLRCADGSEVVEKT